jgi:hypothetical protein
MDRDLQKLKAIAMKTQTPEVRRIQAKVATDGFEGEKFFKRWLKYQSSTKKFIDGLDAIETNCFVMCLKAYFSLRQLNREFFLEYAELPFTQELSEQSYLQFAKMTQKQHDIWDEEQFDKLYEYLLIQKAKLDGKYKEGPEHYNTNGAYLARIHEAYERIFKQQLIRGKMIDP